MRRLYLLAATALIISCAPVAQEKVDTRISEVEIKISKVEQKQQDLEKDIEKVEDRIDELMKLISDLRLEIEKLKLGAVSAQPPPAPPPKPEEKEALVEEKKTEVVQKPEKKEEEMKEKESDIERAYRNAIELYSLKKLYEARDAFLSFIKDYKENKYTDNAFFWIGRIYQELGNLDKAQAVYKKLIEKCEAKELPDCNKLPDAYYQLMKINMDKGNLPEANKYYSILIKKFPTSDAAVRAREQKLLMGE